MLPVLFTEVLMEGEWITGNYYISIVISEITLQSFAARLENYIGI